MENLIIIAGLVGFVVYKLFTFKIKNKQPKVNNYYTENHLHVNEFINHPKE